MATYLARNGKTFGPFSMAEVEALKQNGEFFKYEWMWDGTSPDWSRVPPPAPPPPMPPSAPAAAAAAAAASAASTAAGQTPSAGTPRPAAAAAPQPSIPTRPAVAGAPARAAGPVSSKQFQAICHDFHHLISGVATQVTQAGCELVCNDTETPPALGARSKAWIDLLDEASEQSVTLKVTMKDLEKKNGRWVYKISWDGCPLI